VEGKLYLKLGNEYAPCPTGGGDIFSAALGITVTCPQSAELCDMYPAMKPAIAVNFPVGNQVYSPAVMAEFELTNFEVPQDGELRITINGRLHEVWNVP
jgi:hypothetical protein